MKLIEVLIIIFLNTKFNYFLAYKKKAVKWHPDKNINNKEKASEMFKKIKLAVEFLKNTDSRKEYDKVDELKRRKEKFEQERKADLSSNRKYYMDKLKKQEQEAEKKHHEFVAKKKLLKQQAKNKLLIDEEKRKMRQSEVEKLSQEASQLLKKNLDNLDKKKEEQCQPFVNFSFEDFKKFERDVLS